MRGEDEKQIFAFCACLNFPSWRRHTVQCIYGCLVLYGQTVTGKQRDKLYETFSSKYFFTGIQGIL